ncbi:hypothetical protein PCC21_013410 [Pectobacterium carotovorum subsp. carotovorum PCC21]|nr:hypothetical protein PCC21_013410 [Pectobacterium carotovorum subsp. carotovorum PCC21]
MFLFSLQHLNHGDWLLKKRWYMVYLSFVQIKLDVDRISSKPIKQE